MTPRRPRIAFARRSPSARPRLESLEGRVVLSWAGTPPASIVPPTAAVGVTLDAQGDAAGSAAIAANEVDYFSFVAPTAGSYRVNALTPASSLDTVLGVFTAAGARVAFNDDISPSNRDSQLSTTLAAGGRYYFGITNYSGTAGGAYTWSVDGPAAGVVDDAYEQNDALAQATSLGALATQRTVAGLVLADADWFRFSTAATGTASNSVSIAFQNAQGNLGLELYNASGQLLGSSNTTGNAETVSLNGLAAGTYYARAFGVGGATNPGYSLTVSPPPAPTPTPPPTPTGAFDIVIRASGLTATQQSAFDRAAERWERIIVGDVPNATYQGVAVDDLLIDARSVAIDGAGGVLGQAGPDSLRPGSSLPIHGTMQFDTADLASMEANGTLTEVILHEMGHVLGIGTIWQNLRLLAGAGTANPTFTGPRATAEYNALFGTSAAGVPVEGTPAPAGTRDGHWRESVFANELMTGYISAASNPISRMTVASLADLGYSVNLAAADPYARPGSGTTARVVVSAGGGGTSLVSAEPEATTARPHRRGPAGRPVSSWMRRHAGQPAPATA